MSDLSGTSEIATLIGKELGKPDLQWVRFPASELEKTLLSYGFAEGAAAGYVEMFETLDSGRLFEDFVRSKTPASGVTIEQFAKQFATVYQQR